MNTIKQHLAAVRKACEPEEPTFTCPKCNGYGYITGFAFDPERKDVCNCCNGHGRVEEERFYND